jgi:ribonuclease-3
LLIEDLEGRLGHTFADRGLLLQALTHRSWFEGRPGSVDYERLEFLGDAILQAATTAELVARFPTLDEGGLTVLRQQFVREATLAEIARALDIGPALRLGVGEERTGRRDRTKVLADVVEAILGAIFLDAGFEAARRPVAAWMDRHRFVLGTDGIVDNARGKLQEITQARWREMPEYAFVRLGGPPHAPVFLAEIRVGGRPIARAQGPSKKRAGELAAQAAYLRLEPVPAIEDVPVCQDEPVFPPGLADDADRSDADVAEIASPDGT